MNVDRSTREAVVAEVESGARNMYGCAPCPRCGGGYRWPGQDGVQYCDDCQFRESYDDGLLVFLAAEEG